MWYGKDEYVGDDIPAPNPTPKASEVTERWEATGLLEKLESDKIRCALELDSANTWIKNNERFLSPIAAELFLPLTRRMYNPQRSADFRKYARFLNALAFCGNETLLKALKNAYTVLDMEVEYAVMCEYYMKEGCDINVITKPVLDMGTVDEL